MGVLIEATWVTRIKQANGTKFSTILLCALFSRPDQAGTGAGFSGYPTKSVIPQLITLAITYGNAINTQRAALIAR